MVRVLRLSFVVFCCACGDSRDGWLLRPEEPSALSALPDAVLFHPYDARLRASDGTGLSGVAVVGLPRGLGVSVDGQITGTPEDIGEFMLTVDYTPTSGSALTAAVPLVVGPGDAVLGGGLSWEQSNNFSEERGQMTDPWLRVAGGGSGDQQEITLHYGLYEAGPNGALEGGRGDDRWVTDLATSSVTVDVVSWTAVQSGAHVPDGDAPVIDQLTIRAGGDTGTLMLRVSHPDYAAIEQRVIVVPPDWCPAGVPGQGCE